MEQKFNYPFFKFYVYPCNDKKVSKFKVFHTNNIFIYVCHGKIILYKPTHSHLAANTTFNQQQNSFCVR